MTTADADAGSGDSTPSSATVAAALEDVVKEYHRGTVAIRALDGASVDVASGELTAVVGPSGSGKSTLLHLLGGLDAPTSGTVRVDGVDLASLKDRELTRLRREKIGFVFQFFNLLPTLSAWENVATPGILSGGRLARSKARAHELLDRVGLADRADHGPAELSGGEMQRVAIARALFSDPKLILADEPTGNLDSAAANDVLDLLEDLCKSDGRTIVVVTHDEAGAERAKRIVKMLDGKIDA